MKGLAKVLVLGLAVVGGSTAHAQSLDRAIQEFNSRNFEDAAFNLYDVLSNDAQVENRLAAEYYLAQSLFGLELDASAMYYYKNILTTGPQHPFFLKAIEGLLRTRERTRDDLFIPAIVDRTYTDAFGQLERDVLDEVHFIIGEQSYRKGKLQEALSFLTAVRQEGKFYARAQYILAVLAARANDHDNAIQKFEAVLANLPASEEERLYNELNREEKELAQLKELALLGIAREYYVTEKFDRATEYYDRIPRFGWSYYNSMFENAWTRFRNGLDAMETDPKKANEEFGHALGEITSVQSPFFAKRFLPEIWVLQATVYFHVCQWDRVRRTLEVIENEFGPLHASLEKLLADEKDPYALYKTLTTPGQKIIPEAIAREVRRNQRLRDYYSLMGKLEDEQKKLNLIAKWKGSRLGNEVGAITTDFQGQLQKAVGAFVQQNLQAQLQDLAAFIGQARILKFETATAETKWLEQGRDIEKGKRAKLPRPTIPDETYQHWEFRDEYWIDEVGYIQHTIRSECN